MKNSFAASFVLLGAMSGGLFGMYFFTQPQVRQVETIVAGSSSRFTVYELTSRHFKHCFLITAENNKVPDQPANLHIECEKK